MRATNLVRTTRFAFLCLEAGRELLRARVEIRVRKFGRIREDLAVGVAPKSNPDGDEVLRVKAALRLAGRAIPIKLTCLPRAIAGKRMLRRRGFDSDIRIGARMDNNVLSAHAWLVAEDVVVSGGLLKSHYSQLISF
ncbi:MAG: hypothetical protein ACI9BV_003799 [Rhodothermales bacterium]|jgi:hypothetical protein